MLYSMDQVRALFHKNDLRCTRQRELVFSALASTTAHPTAEELYHAVRGIDAGLSLATVYNTLEALVERGLSRRISNGSGPCHYDADMQPHVHVSLRDGAVRDVPDDLSEKLLAGLTPEVMKELEQRMGVKIASIGMQIAAAPAKRCNCDADYSGEC